MGILKKEINKTELNTNEKSKAELSKEKLLLERVRIDREKQKIEDTITALRRGISESSQFKINSFNTEKLLSQVNDSTLEENHKKIDLLRRALKADRLQDEKYREAAKDYVTEIEDIILEMQIERVNLVNKATKVLEDARAENEKLIKQAENLIDDICEALQPLSKSLYTTTGNILSGDYVLKQIKDEIKNYEEES